jgi:hypothetical protein
MRGTPSVATGTDVVEDKLDIGNPVMLGQGRTCANNRDGGRPFASDTPGTPPVDVL